ncbi:PREDICTED: class I histocompatibility antigen, F10 alpha chain-like, partial [Leptosomus discolor]|uniref:class I histocompatibility antigen, F10 alpha chain-like n=1 Tax=Leptosomus discolor TaxID=188344 RepID=UPI000522D914
LHSLHYFYVAVSEPSPGVPQFMSVGYVDGNLFVCYDSEMGRMVPRADWVRGAVDSQYWDRNTQYPQGWQHVNLENLNPLQRRYNQSGTPGGAWPDQRKAPVDNDAVGNTRRRQGDALGRGTTESEKGFWNSESITKAPRYLAPRRAAV